MPVMAADIPHKAEKSGKCTHYDIYRNIDYI